MHLNSSLLLTIFQESVEARLYIDLHNKYGRFILVNKKFRKEPVGILIYLRVIINFK